MPAKLKDTETRVKVGEMPPAPRKGGEVKPYDYPHLYQIQAGDWRISYAVEQNHLAILVLEVLNPDGTVKEDPARENMTRKMKVKLLDWPEGSPSRDLPPEELGKKVKIRLLDLADELQAEDSSRQRRASKVRFVDASVVSAPSHRVTLHEEGATEKSSSSGTNRKVTPLDSPTL